MRPRTATPSPRPDRVLTRAAIRAAERLDISRKDLARILGISAASASRLSQGRTVDPESKEGELAALFLRCFRSLDALLGGDQEKMRAWMRSPNRHLGGVPGELACTVTGLVQTADYLDAMRGKV